MTIRLWQTVMLLPLLASTVASAQYRNLYPCAECAVYDNNGTDLRGFIASNRDDLIKVGSKINEYSDSGWGYLAVKTAHIPSIDQQQYLNYSEYINTTFALYKTLEGAKSTWWGRQCNTPSGPLVCRKVDFDGDLGMDLVRYYEVTHDLEQKRFAIVEYFNSGYNQLDYDVLLKNYILIEHGVVKDIRDYKGIINYYDSFLKKFTYMEDPLILYKSFITCLTVNGHKYIGYFNVINGKLAGHLETVDIQYEKDKDDLVTATCKKLLGNEIYVYGDDIFDLEKAFLKYERTNSKVKIKRRITSSAKSFNTDKAS